MFNARTSYNKYLTEKDSQFSKEELFDVVHDVYACEYWGLNLLKLPLNKRKIISYDGIFTEKVKSQK